MTRSVSIAVLAMVLAACSGVSDEDDAPATTSAPRAPSEATCDGIAFDPDTADDAPLADQLPSGPAGAIDDIGNLAVDPDAGWRIMEETETFVGLLRPLDEPEDLGGGDIRTFAAMTLEPISGATNVAEGTWMRTASGTCTPRRTPPDGLAAANLALAVAPAAEDIVVDLAVTERDCASGRPAVGRIVVIELVEEADRVEVWLGVEPLPGGQDCQGNPPTPLSVELAEPIGGRVVMDRSVVPSRPLVAAD